MGLAASQAKLLSITARLSDNELRSQSLTAAKMGLAHETAEASRKYINALNKNEFIYRTYDQNGDKCYVPCTGMQLSLYGPLKNQYCLVNTKGQIMVSELDGANYEDSADINEFLAHYGIDPIPTGEYKQVKNPEYSDGYEKWKEGYDEWMAGKPNPDDFWIEDPNWVPGSSDSNYDLFEKFVKGTAGGCFTTSVNPCGAGYLGIIHFFDVMEHMMDVGTHTTTSGETFTIASTDSRYGGQAGGHWWVEGSQRESINNVGGSPSVMAELREAMEGKYACGHNHDSSDETHYIDCPTSWGGCGTPHPLDCECDERCDGDQLITDKIEDLYYDFFKMYCNGNGYLNKGLMDLSNPEELELFRRYIHFFYHDLKGALEETNDEPGMVFDEDGYNDALGEWQSHKPEPYDIPEYIDEEILEYEDKDKAQWYVNLWHRMNGPSQLKDGMTSSVDETNVTTTEYGTEFVGESTTVTTTWEGPRWYILEDGLMNSQDWLKYALETGTVSLERVNYTNPTEVGTGLKDATWTSIIYTNALDISEQQNEKAIAIAEAEYEQKSREIENKDKQYDSILKLLDTEHNALQQELETAKTVIQKNTERTLKIYSA